MQMGNVERGGLSQRVGDGDREGRERDALAAQLARSGLERIGVNS